MTKEIIKEVRGYTGTGYEKYRDKDKIKSVFIKGFIREFEHKKYFMLIDSQGNLIDEVFNFLNSDDDDALGECSYKKRELAYTALKHLYSFKELNDLNSIYDINDIQYRQLESFLIGGEREGNYTKYECSTVRKNNTINNYYHVYRMFFSYLGIEDSIFHKKKGGRIYKGTGHGFMAHAKSTFVERYQNTRKVPTIKKVPKYISYDEYEKIINLIRNRQTEALDTNNQGVYVIALRAELIIHLMYVYGMRIGEVHGLTLEDINEIEIDEEDYGEIIIRNRHTDSPHQNAKGCMTINYEHEYINDGYHQIGLGKAFGCERIIIFEETLDLINDYISASRRYDFLGVKARDNLKKKNIAAKVTNRKDIKYNQYIFISNQGNPLNPNTWNDYLREIFKEVGISIDKADEKYDKQGTRENNLNHRFRHGFAMYKKEKENQDMLQLSKSLRQSNINSCSIYFNPTEIECGLNANVANRLLKEGGIKI